jgi:hypothetical protein
MLKPTKSNASGSSDAVHNNLRIGKDWNLENADGLQAQAMVSADAKKFYSLHCREAEVFQLSGGFLRGLSFLSGI